MNRIDALLMGAVVALDVVLVIGFVWGLLS